VIYCHLQAFDPGSGAPSAPACYRACTDLLVAAKHGLIDALVLDVCRPHYGFISEKLAQSMMERCAKNETAHGVCMWLWKEEPLSSDLDNPDTYKRVLDALWYGQCQPQHSPGPLFTFLDTEPYPHANKLVYGPAWAERRERILVTIREVMARDDMHSADIVFPTGGYSGQHQALEDMRPLGAQGATEQTYYPGSWMKPAANIIPMFFVRSQGVLNRYSPAAVFDLIRREKVQDAVLYLGGPAAAEQAARALREHAESGDWLVASPKEDAT
jgi:hypothetical protein